MNSHLTQDQLARWIVGDSSPEERQHVLHCLQCSAEAKDFREAVSTFQVAMKEWSDQEAVPVLDAATAGMNWSAWFHPSLRWVVAGLGVVAVVLLPVFTSVKEQQPEVVTTVNEDALLMEEVTLHLARPLPVSMERVIALLPEPERPEREENQ